MAYRVTRKEWEAVREQAYTVIVFYKGERLITIGGCSALSALGHVMAYSKKHVYATVLVFNEKDLIDPTTGIKDLCTEKAQAYYAKFGGEKLPINREHDPDPDCCICNDSDGPFICSYHFNRFEGEQG